MKNLVLIMMFSFFLVSCTPAYALFGKNKKVETVEDMQPVKQTLKEKAVIWAKDTGYVIALSFIFGLFAKKGWSQLLKKIANKGTTVSKEIGEFFMEGSSFLQKLDDSIKDDGKLKENSAKELLAAGKELIAEAKDVVIVIKPKKV